MIEANDITKKFSYRFIKRFFDIIFSLFLIIILFPFLLLISMLIALFNGLPIYYSWRVHGFQGKKFIGYKFRTMHRYADLQKDQLQHMNEMSGPVFKVSNDPRITKVGKILRKYSLDELPQLWSVLKGDMSLVGPHPPLQSEWPHFEEWHKRKLSVTPGLTCLWQVNGRNKINKFDDWVKMDLEYIDNWNIWLDIRILLKTIPTIIKGSGR